LISELLFFGNANSTLLIPDGDGECNYWIPGDKDPDALADVGSK